MSDELTLTIKVAREDGVWRATLGDGPDKGYSSVATDPYEAACLTLGKAREGGWPKPAEPTPNAAKPAPAPAVVAPVKPA